MKFDLAQAENILSRTPSILEHLLSDLPTTWIENNEGAASWSPKEIVAHLIFGERTDWLPRIKIIIDDSTSNYFDAFDMTGHKEILKQKELSEMLDIFKTEREQNLAELAKLNLEAFQLEMVGIHAEFGPVTLQNHLAAWVVHDLGHIAQISRVMAKQYTEEVGPWTKYMSVLNDRLY